MPICYRVAALSKVQQQQQQPLSARPPHHLPSLPSNNNSSQQSALVPAHLLPAVAAAAPTNPFPQRSATSTEVAPPPTNYRSSTNANDNVNAIVEPPASSGGIATSLSNYHQRHTQSSLRPAQAVAENRRRFNSQPPESTTVRKGKGVSIKTKC